MKEKQNQRENAVLHDLIAALSSENGVERQHAREALVDIGKPAAAAVERAFSEAQSHALRWETTKALAELGEPETAATLVKALGDDESDIRWLAAEGLILLGDNVLLPLLEALVRGSGASSFREGAHHVLHDLRDGEWREVLAPVLSALGGSVPDVQVPVAAEEALTALRRLRSS